ncbi:cobalamin adenosyltransferase [Candidatus Tenderia electrophaga]|jgi:cob(I)alamin adenosyltransferase|uniref:Corrinoid adenosyltransferase n=1 Tax=Candidatus Tenderia electrophaga TaxID=1748243 RepID=A0A0S2T9L0_9GAMM|nr:cobalamin adenosyltransferase [Candidatus Tenderia electrophaga]
MGHRLSKIYTRTGDSGMTGLSDGARVEKDSARIEAMGAVDELNSHLGATLAQSLPDALRDCLTQIQHRLFDLGGELSMPGDEYSVLRSAHIQQLEQWLDEFNAELPPLKEFILPGGNAAAASCHIARAVCRRAERRVASLLRQEAVNQQALSYLNRLSDLLFVMARLLARENGGSEVLWRPAKAEDN